MDETRRRRSTRIPGYSYASAGAYFLTICAFERACVFGNVVDGGMQSSKLGAIVHDEWLRTAELRPCVSIDQFVVMPNHFHGILLLKGGQALGRDSASHEAFGAPTKASVPTIVRAFKSAVTRTANAPFGARRPVWQRGYHEHVIRSEASLERIRRYVVENPLRWESDRENPRRGCRVDPDPWDFPE